MTDVALALRDVSKFYGSVKAVQQISLQVPVGQRLAIIGPNGAGKSTLFGVIAGEHRATEGSLQVLGEDVTAWNPSKMALHGVSRTFQVARTFATRTVRENVLLAARAKQRHTFRGWDVFANAGDLQLRVDQALELTGLRDIPNQLAANLAQGDRKLLEVAMALAQQPRVLLLDEPTAGMSYRDSKRTVEVLREVASQDPELTMILSAHDMEVVFALAQRIALMHQGELVIDDTPERVAGDPRTREIYLGRQAG